MKKMPMPIPMHGWKFIKTSYLLCTHHASTSWLIRNISLYVHLASTLPARPLLRGVSIQSCLASSWIFTKKGKRQVKGHFESSQSLTQSPSARDFYWAGLRHFPPPFTFLRQGNDFSVTSADSQHQHHHTFAPTTTVNLLDSTLQQIGKTPPTIST